MSNVREHSGSIVSRATMYMSKLEDVNQLFVDGIKFENDETFSTSKNTGKT